jgi:hypothetical protein
MPVNRRIEPQPREVDPAGQLAKAFDDARGNLPATSVDFEDGQERVRDIDFAMYLGFREPRAIRKLIERHASGLGTLESRDTVSRQSTNNGGSRSFVVAETWLTEPQALYVMAKCETPKAKAGLKTVIDVFVKTRRAGEAVSHAAPQVEELLKLGRLLAPMVAPLLAELVKIAGSLTPPPERATTAKPTSRAAPSLTKGSTDWFRTFEYLNRRGIASTSEQRKRLGVVAASLMKKEGIEPGKTTSARFGSVNTYPAHVLEQAWSIAQPTAQVESVA